jgi:hypothetical protein
MRVRVILKVILSVAGLLLSLSASELGFVINAYQAGTPQGFSFNLTRLPENASRFSLVISDGDERTISGNFSVEQLQVLRAVMTEAEKFALSDEAAGKKAPITTRFLDKREPAFMLDVEKLGTQSSLFLTLKSEIGRMTAEAGKLNRITKHQEGFFFDLLARLESVLPKLPAQPSK